MVKQPVKGDVSGTIRHWVKPLVSPRHSLCQERHCTNKARCNAREATRLRSLSRWIPQRVKMHHASTWFVSFIKWLSHVCMYEYVWIYSNIYIYIYISSGGTIRTIETTVFKDIFINYGFSRLNRLLGLWKIWSQKTGHRNSTERKTPSGNHGLVDNYKVFAQGP